MSTRQTPCTSIVTLQVFLKATDICAAVAGLGAIKSLRCWFKPAQSVAIEESQW